MDPNLVMLILMGIFTVFIGIATSTSRSVASAADRSASSLGLALLPELEETVRRRIRRRNVFTMTGAVLGGIVGYGLMGFLPIETGFFGSPSTWLILVAWFAGLGVGATLSALTDRTTIDPDAPRVARTGVVGLADYSAPVERLTARAVVAVALIVAMAALVLLATGAVPPENRLGTIAPLIMSGFAALALAVYEIGGRRIATRGRPSASPAELAWDDALRSLAIRDMVGAPLFVGVYSAIMLVAAVMPALRVFDDLTGVIVTGSVIGLIAVVAITAMVISLLGRPQQHYLRRLWPEVAAAGDALTAQRAAASATPASTPTPDRALATTPADDAPSTGGRA